MGKTTKRNPRRDAIADELDGPSLDAVMPQEPTSGPVPPSAEEVAEAQRRWDAALARTSSSRPARPDYEADDAEPAPPVDARVTLGAWEYTVCVTAGPTAESEIYDVRATPRRRGSRTFAAKTAGSGTVATIPGLALTPGAHALYALSGQGKSRTLAALHERMRATEAVAEYEDLLDPNPSAEVVLPKGAACIAAQAGEPDGRYDPRLAGMAAAIAWALRAPGRFITVDSVTDLSRASGDGGTMGGGLSSGFATDMRHLSAALLARGSAALLVVNPLAEGAAAGLFREVLFGSMTGLWIPTELGASAPTGQQRGITRNVSRALWGSEAAPQSAPAVAKHTGLLVSALAGAEPTFGLPFGRVTRPFTY